MSLRTQNSIDLKGWIVLIVEDDQDTLTVASKLLEFYGATVHTALSVERGLALLKTL
ncbi:MAG: hypothetical protein HS103_11235 [Anaerolineales bacterium]|nr:hypothetical protein [Anaerolineales bacterium]